jgi:PBP1b-binding outer membrane lipoprotein LpoB
MKKILAMLLAAILLLGLCSCGKEKDDIDTTPQTTTSAPTTEAESTDPSAARNDECA